MNFTRRDFVRTALAAPFAVSALRAADPPRGFPGMIVRNTEPRNLEFPVSELRDPIVPNEQFFVRSHFAVPKLDVKEWRLKVEGAVETPLDLRFDDLTQFASRTQTATLECAGNSRVFLTPSVSGLQWGNGAVGHAEWAGVPLAAILEKAGLKASAVEVILEGADRGPVNSDPKSPGPIAFARSLPVEKARQPEVLLAHTMNGEKLPAAHGYPLRAVVGGWYGVASVKWLTRIVVSDKPFQGFWQSLDYAVWDRRSGLPTLVPVTAMQPKAILATPSLHEVIPAGKTYRLFGAAWAGERAVRKVEVSLDGGKTWAGGKLLADPKPFQWVLWEHMWENPAMGPAAITVRATDDQGNTQPATRDADRRTYAINHLLPVGVTVR